MICSKCERELPLDAFSVTSCRGKPLRRRRCKGCMLNYYTAYAHDRARRRRVPPIVQPMPTFREALALWGLTEQSPRWAIEQRLVTVDADPLVRRYERHLCLMMRRIEWARA